LTDPRTPGSRLPRARVEIDLGALQLNFVRLAERVAPARLLPVLKADAYGHGAAQVAAALAGLGPAGFGVARVEEGTLLRRHGVGERILVFGPFTGAELPEMRRDELTPVVSDLEQLRILDAFAREHGWRAPVHLKIDTGMNRLGIPLADAGSAIAALRASPCLSWQGLLSHLADADRLDSPLSQQQQSAFESVLQGLPPTERDGIEVHLANSAAALTHPSARFDLVRPGLALYGGTIAGSDLPLEPVLSLRAPLVQVKRVAAGDLVGYGGRWRAPRSGYVGIVGVGYADGYPWRAGGTADALVGSMRTPVIGAVSMDLLAVDLGGRALEVGEEVVLIGRQGEAEITVAELAARSGTIAYEILCQLRLRLPRIWLARGREETAATRDLEVAR